MCLNSRFKFFDNEYNIKLMQLKTFENQRLSCLIEIRNFLYNVQIRVKFNQII